MTIVGVINETCDKLSWENFSLMKLSKSFSVGSLNIFLKGHQIFM